MAFQMSFMESACLWLMQGSDDSFGNDADELESF